jgi:hypothetical protein
MLSLAEAGHATCYTGNKWRAISSRWRVSFPIITTHCFTPVSSVDKIQGICANHHVCYGLLTGMLRLFATKTICLINLCQFHGHDMY